MKISLYTVIFLIIPVVAYSQVDTFLLCRPGDEVVLDAPAGGSLYSWSPIEGLDNPGVASPTASPLWNTMYVVEVAKDPIGDNLIKNHDFEDGNVGFVSEYPYSNRIFTQGLFGVTDSAEKLNAIYFTDCPDHTSGSGLMMVVDGSPTPELKVWCQEISVKPNTVYAFSTWLSSVLGANPAQLQFFINDEPLGLTFTANESVCVWRQFYEVWDSKDNISAEICIVNKNTDPNGNDFALDDFLFIEVGDVVYDSIMVMLDRPKISFETRVTPDCDFDNGTIDINVSDAVGKLSYSLDGLTFQDEPIFDNIGKGNYTVFVKDETQASVQNECLYEDIHTVNQNPCPIYIPNIINLDSGNSNGVFEVALHPEFDGEFVSMDIFDRWGKRVYRADDHESILAGWNGALRDGSLLSAGVYSYIIKVNYPEGLFDQFVGEITIIN